MEKYKFKLYVVENTSASIELVDKVAEIFKIALNDEYSLEVIDILKHPEDAIKDKILATPTLILEIPLPPKRIIGNIGDSEKILLSLNII